MESFAALKDAKKTERHFPSDFWCDKVPRCPHCGRGCGPSEHDWYDLYEEGEHEKECPHCDGEFVISTSVSYSYSFSTDEQEGV